MSIFNKIRPSAILDHNSCFRSVTIAREEKKAELMDKFKDVVSCVITGKTPPPKLTHHDW